MKTVYLAGPVLGCSGEQANGWRSMVASTLLRDNIRAISPLRCEPLRGERYGSSYSDPKFGTSQAIGSKNLFDVRTCDMGIYYLPVPEDGRHQSWGTMQEMAWAYVLGKPTILVSDDPEIRAHPVINANSSWAVDDLSEAMDIVVGILGGYVEGGKNV